MTDRVVLLVLDSVGVGSAPDAADFGDEGADTLGNIARAVGGLELPNLRSLGLGHIAEIPGVEPVERPRAAAGRATEVSAGKDTTTGHWELAGLRIDAPFPTFPDGFPPEILEPFAEATGRGVLGNRAASGTVILEELGVEHLETGKWIVYTSADSVFQIAAHEERIPLDELYAACREARRILDPWQVGRVIARPFVGDGPGDFRRTVRRRDFSLPPPGPTVLEQVADAGLPVASVGKISDIFAGRGITSKRPTESNLDGIRATVEALDGLDRGLVVTNLIDFDSLYGHRRDPEGYARCLEECDRALPPLLEAIDPERDVLILTADHGNDPTWSGTDHTREQVPILVFGPASAAGVDLGVRETFADVGATVAHLLGVQAPPHGTSFAAEIL